MRAKRKAPCAKRIIQLTLCAMRHAPCAFPLAAGGKREDKLSMLNTRTLHYVTRFVEYFPNIFTDKKLIAVKLLLVKGIQEISPGILKLAFKLHSISGIKGES